MTGGAQPVIPNEVMDPWSKTWTQYAHAEVAMSEVALEADIRGDDKYDANDPQETSLGHTVKPRHDGGSLKMRTT